MSDELDVNKMAVEFVNSHIDTFYDTGKSIWKDMTDKARLHMQKSYREYLTCVTERYSKAKSFFVRSEPTYLYDFYVPAGISSKREQLPASVKALSKASSFTVITGSGGSGKSMFMRHLLLDSVKQKQKVPVFIELRELNQTDISLIELIQSTLSKNHFELDAKYIDKAIQAGHFILLLDGFDELTSNLRKSVGKQILQLAQKYDENMIVLSSRPDDEFSGWTLFNVFAMTPLTLEQACELVRLVPFDVDLKNKFTIDLSARLFKEHQSFLSNPLLLSIMLLTYSQSADIPTKLSVFYSQAYEALFHRHDALKGGFKRERSSNLDIQDFAKVFSAFAIQTYDKRIFQMSRSDALGYLEKSKKLSNINFNTSEYLKDAEQAVCLLVEDGLDIVFAHRSFQEYFTAKFILSAEQGVRKKLVSRFSQSLGRDSVISLLHEMNPELVERDLIVPRIESLQRALGIKKRVGITHYKKYIMRLVDIVHINVDGTASFSVNDADLFVFLQFIVDVYPKFEKAIAGRLHMDKAFWSKFSDKERAVEFRLRDMKPLHEIISFMANGAGFISKETLELVIELRNDLLSKFAIMDQSLEEILISN